MNSQNFSRRLALGLGLFLIVAGLIVWLRLPDYQVQTVEEPLAEGAAEDQSSPTTDPVPSEPVDEMRVAGIVRPILWTATGGVSGEALDPTSLSTKVALIQGRQPPGRSASFTVQTPGVLAGLQRGSEVILPLPGGEEAMGVVNVVLVDANGTVRAGGSLQGGGSFSVAEASGQMAGRILRPQQELAYVMSAQAGGLRIEERWLSQVLCFNMPREQEGTQAAPLEFGPQAAPPLLSSRPGATAVLYLDFDGETVTDPDWNEGETIVAAPSTLNDSQIMQVWERVKEDFLPFNIDVTTDVSRYQSAPIGRRTRVIVTPTSDWAGLVGGVALLDSFARAGTIGFSSDVPAWVFNSSVVGVAETISHEIGHTLGLKHDGRLSPVEEYFTGHGSGSTSWGPIMGSSHTRSVTQWSKGEYANANNSEDDLAIIAGEVPTPMSSFEGFEVAYNDIGYVADEAGDERPSAAILGMNADAISQNGVIATENDVDYFEFSTPAAQITINAVPAMISPNLDILLELESASGTTLASSNPFSLLSASLSHPVPAGTYFLKIRGTGRGDVVNVGYSAYGSIGHYDLSGSFASITPVITSANSASVGIGHLFSYQITGTHGPTSFDVTDLPAGLVFDTDTGVISGRLMNFGEYVIGLSATNAFDTGTGVLTVSVVDAVPAVPSQTNALQVLKPGDAATLSVSGYSVNGAISYQWMHNGFPIVGATSDSLTLPDATTADGGAYWAVLTNSIGSFHSHPIFVRIVPDLTQVRAWGANNHGQLEVPMGMVDAINISAGGGHGLALRRDGTVVNWGHDEWGQATPPPGLSGVAAIAAGGRSSLALKSDGTVVAWGYQLHNVPSGLNNVMALAVGSDHALALKTDGTVVAWGTSGPLEVPETATDIVAVAAGGNHSLARKRDGTFVSWGSGNQINIPSGLNDVIAFDDGNSTSIGLRSAGTVVVWGSITAVVPPGLSGVSAVSAGDRFLYALKHDGTVVGWGSDWWGETAPPADLAEVISVSGGGTFALALRDAAGDLPPSIITHPAATTRTEAESVTFTVAATGSIPLTYQWRKDGENIAGAISTSLSFHSLALGDAGAYDVVVTNHLGSATSSVAELIINALPVITTPAETRHVVAPGASLDLAITATGTGTLSYQWIHNGRLILGATTPELSLSDLTPRDSGWYALRVTDDHGTVVSGGIFITCTPALTQVRGWGNDNSGIIAGIPDGMTDVVAVSAGPGYALALKADGTAAIWGIGASPQVVSGRADIVAISAATNSSNAMLLISDGTVVVQPYNSSLPLDVPADLARVVAIDGGANHLLALRSDGTVRAWGGNNTNGELEVPAGLTGVVEVAAGSNHSLALKQDGTVVAWGRDSHGQSQVPAGLVGVVAVAAGYDHSLALKSDGTVVAWGSNANGQADVPSGLANVVAIAGGNSHSIALTNDGALVGWGSNFFGEISMPTDIDSVLAVSATQGVNFVLLDATADSVPLINIQPIARTVVENESVTFEVGAEGAGPKSYQWRKDGVNIDGANSPVLTMSLVRPEDAGEYDVIVANYIGPTPSISVTLTVVPLPVITAFSPVRQVLHVGADMQLAVTATGTGPLAYQWIQNGRAIEGATASGLSRVGLTIGDGGWYAVRIIDDIGTRLSAPVFVQVAPTSTHVMEQGINDSEPTNIPAGLDNVAAISAGGNHTVALKFDGTVAAWGDQSYTGAAALANLSEIVAVEAGNRFTLVLKSDGTVSSWGTTGDVSVIPPGLSGVVAISAGYSHALALKIDGTVVAWGNSSSGKTAVPTGLAGVIAIAAGADHSMALKGDGSVVAWGDNDHGQSTVPLTLTDVVGIAAGFSHSMAVRNDGTVVAWGLNNDGQSSVPAELQAVRAISAGYAHSVAVKDDGTLVFWGSNSFGESDPAPTFVNVIMSAAGNYFTAILRDTSADTVPEIQAHPVSLTRAERSSAEFSVTVSGAEPMYYQWRHNGVAISGATGATLVVANAGLTSAGTYDVVVSNHRGSITSSPATLTINPIPVVSLLNSSHHMMVPGQELALSVSATGTGPLGYQWLHNGRQIPGAVGPDLHLTDLLISDGGWYAIMVTDDYGTRYSTPYFVLVTPLITQVREWGALGTVLLPENFNDAIAIDAGGTFSVALRRNGTVFLWGSMAGWSIPPDLSEAVAVAAGHSFVLALDSDGMVSAWGQSHSWQTSVPADLDATVAISAGAFHALVLSVDGSVSGWGDDFYGQTSIPDELGHVIAIAAGHSHSLALRSDGTVVAWGRDLHGQASVPDGLDDVVGIAADENHSFAFKADGTVVSWGSNVPVSLADVIGIAIGQHHGLGLRENGSVFAWGGNFDGQTNVPAGLTNVLDVAAGQNKSLALRDVTGESAPGIAASPSGMEVTELQTATFGVTAAGAGTLGYQWRKNGINISGANQALFEIDEVVPADAGSYDVVVSNHIGSTISTPALLTVRPLPVVTATAPVRQILHPGQNANFSATASGTGTLHYQWVHNGRPVAGATSSMFSIVNLEYDDSGWLILLITDDIGTRRSPPFFVSVVPAATRLIAWGSNSSGEAASPNGLINPIEVDGGSNYSLAIAASGPAFVWGHYTNVDSAPEDLNDVVAVAAGASQALALKSDGTLLGWGTSTLMPAGLRDVVAISGGGHNANLALKSDGTVVNLSSIYSPYAAPSDLTDVVAISAGWDHMLALKVNGTVVAWGGNDSGQLAVPAGLTGVKAIAAGSHHSLALKTDGSVVAWGANDYGQANVPPGLSQVIGIAAGHEHNMALKSDGTVILWGRNGYGQTTPPDGVANVFALGAGRDHSMALVDITGEFPPFITDHPADKDASPGETVEYSIGVTGAGPFIFQWQHRPNEDSAWGNLEDNDVHEGVATSRLSVAVDAGSMNGNLYRCIVTNDVGSVFSNAAQLTIVLPPEITVQPEEAVVAVGGTAQFTVTVAHLASLTYQWYRDGVALVNGDRISGATGPRLVISNVGNADAGSYTVQVVNVAVGTTSDAAALTLQVSSRGRALWLGSAGAAVNSVDLGLTDAAWRIAATADFDGDGKPDLFLENTQTGQRQLWIMSGTGLSFVVDLGFLDPVWEVALTADFNQDGQMDVLLQNVVTGQRTLWLMQGIFVMQGIDMGGLPPSWNIVEAADFNDDGWPDVVLQNRDNGQVVMWLMQGIFVQGALDLGNSNPALRVETAADFNGDGHPDLLVRDIRTGQRHVWTMNGTTRTGTTNYLVEDLPASEVVGAGDFNGNGQVDLAVNAFPPGRMQPADFNRDGFTDIMLENSTTGERIIRMMVGSHYSHTISLGNLDPAWRIAALADFNGDGGPDVLLEHETTGQRTLWLMGGTFVAQGISLGGLDPAWRIRGAADFSGDGHPDVILENTVTGQRTLWVMKETYVSMGISLGALDPAWSIVVINDFNQDGQPDIVLENTATGQRTMWLMNGTLVGSAVSLGSTSTDWSIVGSGDFDEDGHNDLLMENNSTGERKIRYLEGSVTTGEENLGTLDTAWRIVN